MAPDTDVCELHEVYACTVCSGRDRSEQVLEPDGPAIEARFDGQCPECDLPIHIGQIIRRRHYWGGRNAYIHVACADTGVLAW